MRVYEENSVSEKLLCLKLLSMLMLSFDTLNCLTSSKHVYSSGDAVVAENDGVYDQIVSSLNFRRCHLSRFSRSFITSFRMTLKEEYCEPSI